MQRSHGRSLLIGRMTSKEDDFARLGRNFANKDAPEVISCGSWQLCTPSLGSDLKPVFITYVKNSSLWCEQISSGADCVSNYYYFYLYINDKMPS